MFDPFKDFETAGYLRNVKREKDPQTVKEIEHDLFQANFEPGTSLGSACLRLSERILALGGAASRTARTGCAFIGARACVLVPRFMGAQLMACNP